MIRTLPPDNDTVILTWLVKLCVISSERSIRGISDVLFHFDCAVCVNSTVVAILATAIMSIVFICLHLNAV